MLNVGEIAKTTVSGKTKIFIIFIKIVLKDPVKKKSKHNIKINAKSPNLFTIIAFIADLIAEILVSQKIIKRYEHIPIPSHPKNI
jgi:hypothetical protein